MKIETWYVVLFNEIKKVKVVKETKDFIWVQGRVKERKFGCYRSYYDTFAEAKLFLLNRAEKKLEDAHRIVAEAQKELRKVRNLTEKNIK